MSAEPIRVLVFARAPYPGQAKTRLIPALGAEGAARLAARLLDDALQRGLDAAIGPVELCVTPDEDCGWQPYRARAELTVTGQGDGDLGERMARACARVCAQGEAVVLIGSDCPLLDAGRLREIGLALADHDAVLVPAIDGGYVAIALRRFDAGVFTDIPWSTDAVGRLTVARIEALGWRLRQLAALPDIDVPADLHRVPARFLLP